MTQLVKYAFPSQLVLVVSFHFPRSIRPLKMYSRTLSLCVVLMRPWVSSEGRLSSVSLDSWLIRLKRTLRMLYRYDKFRNSLGWLWWHVLLLQYCFYIFRTEPALPLLPTLKHSSNFPILPSGRSSFSSCSSSLVLALSLGIVYLRPLPLSINSIWRRLKQEQSFPSARSCSAVEYCCVLE